MLLNLSSSNLSLVYIIVLVHCYLCLCVSIEHKKKGSSCIGSLNSHIQTGMSLCHEELNEPVLFPSMEGSPEIKSPRDSCGWGLYCDLDCVA